MQIPLNKLDPAPGLLMVAEPFMKDDYFRRSVVLLAEHNEEGTFGFMLNKPLQMKLHEVVDGFPEYNGPVFLGGPVNKNQLFYVHTLGKLIPESIEIGKGIYWGGDFEVVKELIKKQKLGMDVCRFFAGYAGWSPGQLKEELDEKAWLVSDVPSVFLFEQEGDHLWPQVLKKMGKEYSIISNFPEDPSNN